MVLFKAIEKVERVRLKKLNSFDEYQFILLDIFESIEQTGHEVFVFYKSV